MKKLQSAAGIIFGFALIAALLITSFEIVLYSDFDIYRAEYEKYEVLDDLDMNMEDVMYVTREMMEYLRGNGEKLSVITTVEGKRQDFFNEQDRFHMEEVRNLFTAGLDIRTISVAAALICLFFFFLTGTETAKTRKKLASGYRIALAVTGAAVVALGVACIVDFNAVFVKFHHIFFDNNLWIFDPREDYMIRMLPEGLFYDMVIRIGSVFILLLVIFLIISLLCSRKNKISKTYN